MKKLIISLKIAGEMPLKTTDMKNTLFVIAVIIATMACNNAEKHAEHNTGEMAGTADSPAADSAADIAAPVVTADHYFGIIPCADCTGIETEIDLKSDKTYLVHSIYIGRKSTGPGSNEISETGTWMLHGTDTIHLAGRKNTPSMYIRTDTSLIQLDMEGNSIKGKLADKYILKKNK
jgi:uncharacterized lipoprotein NlpE involved in copper resistance